MSLLTRPDSSAGGGFSHPRITTHGMSLMLKPVGSRCNGACTYCYYRHPRDGKSDTLMDLALVEWILRGYLPRVGHHATLVWQGGEPTLAGLEFYAKAVDAVARHARADQTVLHALQTNGSLLDDRWCRFLREHRFLVGLSLDGPASMHDRYRSLMGTMSSHGATVRALRLLRAHDVACNLLSVVHAENVRAPDDVLNHLLEQGAQWLQFIPVVEWEHTDTGRRLASYCPDPESYGTFLCRILDRWLERGGSGFAERGIDALFHALATGVQTLCVFGSTCARTLTIEADGRVYPCDHFVTEEWLLGRIQTDVVPQPDQSWLEDIDAGRFHRFVLRKQDLPSACRGCEWVTLCGGGCPKHRPAQDMPSVLCRGYRLWFSHAVPRLRSLARHLGLTCRKPADDRHADTR